MPSLQQISYIDGLYPPTSGIYLLTNITSIIVPDRRSRIIPEVVVVRRWAVGVLGIWRGEGLGEGWGKGGQFTSNLRPRWTNPVTARRVPSKWKGVQKGNWQGEIKARGMCRV